MSKKWLVGKVRVGNTVQIAVYEPIQGEERQVKTIALCGQVGKADEVESLANARRFALTPQLIESLQELIATLAALENRFTALEVVYFTLSGEQVPACPVGEITRTRAGCEKAKRVLEAAGV
jgi:hypothetical protein